jgi:hypothetical protein
MMNQKTLTHGLALATAIFGLAAQQAKAAELARWKLDQASAVKTAKFYVHKSVEGKHSFDAQAVNPDGGTGALRVDIGTAPAESQSSWKQLYFVFDKGLQAGHHYQISFHCKASQPVAFTAMSIMKDRPWTNIDRKGKLWVKATEQWQKFSFTINPSKDWDCPVRTPYLSLGSIAEGTQLWFYDVRFEDVTE